MHGVIEDAYVGVRLLSFSVNWQEWRNVEQSGALTHHIIHSKLYVTYTSLPLMSHDV